MLSVPSHKFDCISEQVSAKNIKHNLRSRLPNVIITRLNSAVKTTPVRSAAGDHIVGRLLP
jgi:hypothetical protein